MARICVDAMGGDDAPQAIVEGAARASLEGSSILLVGRKDEVTEALKSQAYDPSRVTVVHADEVIPMDAKPKVAVEAMPNASLPVAARMVANGEADALVSAGNTGAVILCCARSFKRISGVKRTALAAVVPTELRRGEKDDPFSLLLDVGATVRVGPEDLANFALMGSAYSRVISKHRKPSVALLSNGSEPNKGPPEIVEAHALLDASERLNFIGNLEGIDISHGRADVIVTDGFTGNVVLKMLEGVSETVMNLAKFAYREKVSWKIALGLLSKGIKQLKDVTDWQQYGGAPVLGFEHLCIKAHGRSGSRAIRNAIKVAGRCVDSDLMQRIQDDVIESSTPSLAE